MAVLHLNSENFTKEVLQAQEPVLVDFYADWCGPCKMMIPVLDQLSAEKADQIEIYKINVDENPDVAKQYRVMSIPNMILFKDGEAALNIVGAMSKNDLWKKVEAAL